MTTNALLSLGDAALLDRTRALVLQSNVLEAELLEHLAEVEDRRLYLERAFPSMFAFCMKELGMSEGVTANRVYVMRLVRRLPVVLEWIRTGRVHLSGLRLLAPHLTAENCGDLLSEAAGMSKRDIEVLVTRFAPKPPVPTTIRRLPTPESTRVPASSPAPVDAAPSSVFTLARPLPPPQVTPLAPNAFKVTLTIDGALRQKVQQAHDLLRHRVGPQDLAAILEEALDLLIDKVKKERFGVGRTPRPPSAPALPGEGAEGAPHTSRHVPADIRRKVYERDEGRCTFTSNDGRRCEETGALEFDHLDGFAITREHSVERLALRCRPHNAHAADKLYGREKMTRMKSVSSSTCPGTCEQEVLF